MCCEKTRTDIFFGGFETHLEHHRSGTLSGYGFSDNGATGLIGATLVRALLYANRCNDLNLRIILWVRDRKKAELLFKDAAELEFVECDITSAPEISVRVDYIVHCANPTSSRFFLNNPADTINIAVEGTKMYWTFPEKKRHKGNGISFFHGGLWLSSKRRGGHRRQDGRF